MLTPPSFTVHHWPCPTTNFPPRLTQRRPFAKQHNFIKPNLHLHRLFTTRYLPKGTSCCPQHRSRAQSPPIARLKPALDARNETVLTDVFPTIDSRSCLHHTYYTQPYNMADAAGAQQVPTFKLVLVGDGGTGKVCIPLFLAQHFLVHAVDVCALVCPATPTSLRTLTIMLIAPICRPPSSSVI